MDLNFLYDIFCHIGGLRKLTKFIETGTYFGRSINVVEKCFQEVHTIEFNLEYYNTVKDRLNDGDKNVRLYHGDSVSVLGTFDKSMFHDALIFLDAHWSPDLHYEKHPGMRECPVIEELSVILPLAENSIIYIHDARYFLNRYTIPGHDMSEWPTMERISDFVREFGYVATHESELDCIVVSKNE